MGFKKNNHTHRVQGLQEVSPTIIISHRMKKLLKMGLHEIVVKFNSIHAIKSTPSHIDLDMQHVLDRHQWVFEKAKDLPPSNGEHDHNNAFLLRNWPQNVHPHRYHFLHKNEIEKIIKELHKDSVICPKTDPYSSQVVMVLKKDGEWHMCHDFRDLNKITINDKIIILVGDDLLYELQNAESFTKLDTHTGCHQIG